MSKENLNAGDDCEKVINPPPNFVYPLREVLSRVADFISDKRGYYEPGSGIALGIIGGAFFGFVIGAFVFPSDFSFQAIYGGIVSKGGLFSAGEIISTIGGAIVGGVAGYYFVDRNGNSS